ncbi:MAG: hydrogen peroxide-inducible genes activator [Paracoccaceae bacterium]|nr:hydrogen peroxide-inducible genes activator [Paracoccaceae bacterium]
MINITLKQLRYFDALVRCGHFGRAASDCSVTQPALSMQVRELEGTLGVALIEKGSRPFRLTVFGQQFAQSIGPVLRGVDELGELARASIENPIGVLRIGVIPTIAPYLLPRVIRNLSHHFADVTLKVLEAMTSNLINGVLEGRLDTAIVALPVSEALLMEHTLFSEEFVLVRPPEDAGKPVPNPEKLKEIKLLLLQEGHCFRDQALEFCNISEPLSHDLMDGSSLLTLVQMVSSGIGVTLIPEMAVDVETRAASVATMRFDAPAPARTVGMIWRKNNPLESHLLQISEVIKDAHKKCQSEPSR